MNSRQTSESTIDKFFQRSGLTDRHKTDCFDYLQHQYPNASFDATSCQGYCSMTILVNDDVIVQFRPLQHQLDTRIADAAKALYEEYAPRTTHLTTLASSGLLVFEMEVIRGIPYQ